MRVVVCDVYVWEEALLDAKLPLIRVPVIIWKTREVRVADKSKESEITLVQIESLIEHFANAYLSQQKVNSK